MIFRAFLRHRVVDALHGGEMAADDVSCQPGSNAAREDALNGSSVKVSEGFFRRAKLLESPQKVKGSFYS